MIKTITAPAYLYQEYYDDQDLQVFVDAYNSMSQEYLDLFNGLNLPIYTKLASDLLDWVGVGVYGISRPLIYNNKQSTIGPYNSFALNTIAFNAILQPSVTGGYVSDDIYKRVMTWNIYKGDGQSFNLQWLKRRVIRFLFGLDGSDVDITSVYGVSVYFDNSNVLQINIQTSSLLSAWIDSGGIIHYGLLDTLMDSDGQLLYDSNGFLIYAPVNSGYTYNLTAIGNLLKNALNSGVCPMPFYITFNVSVT